MTDAEKVALLIGGAGSYTNEQLQGFLDLAGGNIFLAAALALEAAAASAGTGSSTSSRKKVGDVEVDDSSTLKGWLDLAKRYREQAGASGDFEVIEMILTPWQYAEKLANTSL